MNNRALASMHLNNIVAEICLAQLYSMPECPSRCPEPGTLQTAPTSFCMPCHIPLDVTCVEFGRGDVLLCCDSSSVDRM